MKRKLIAYLIIFAGILVMAYPLVDKAYTNHQQEKILAELNSVYQALEEEIIEENVIENDLPLEETVEEVVPPQTENNSSIQSQRKRLGVLKIEKIDLALPILEGTSHSVMKIGAGKVKGTTKIGEIGNLALASHRSHTNGQLFNRLNEIEVGDEIIIESKAGTYVYNVYQQLIVEPIDTTVLNRNNQDKVLTLITCDPMINPTHRLIIQAMQVNN